MKRIHFMYVPFTGLGLYGGYRGDTWLRNRIKIFKQFVVPSLLNQSNKNFIVWISWRPEDKNNPIVKDLWESLNKLRGMRFVFTYGGICFWDDKYNDAIANERLRKALELSLPDLKPYIPEDTECVMMTIQPSDDMYIGRAVEDLQSVEYMNGIVAGYKKGYIMRYDTKEVAEYNPSTTPPFFTIYFSPKIFLDPLTHYEYTGAYRSHEYVGDILKYIEIPARGFVVGTHGENISTQFVHPFVGGRLSKDEAEQVYLQTGCWDTEPLTVEKDMKRKILKSILNMLPRSVQHFVIRLMSGDLTQQVKNYYYHNI